MSFLMMGFQTVKIANTDTNTQLHVTHTHRQRQILRGMVGGGCWWWVTKWFQSGDKRMMEWTSVRHDLRGGDRACKLCVHNKVAQGKVAVISFISWEPEVAT